MPSLTTTTAWMDFADLVFSTVTITARGCQIYNSYAGLNLSVGVFDFGADKTAAGLTAGDNVAITDDIILARSVKIMRDA
jgi:hypothetical protein